MKKWWILLIIAVIAALILEIVQISTQPVTVQYSYTEKPEEQETTIYPDLNSGMYGYEITEEGLNVTQNDPQMYFSVSGLGAISSVSFRFATALSEDTKIQIFYPGADGYSEANSVVSHCPMGIDFWAMEIPAANYDNLRIDIDGKLIPLQSVEVSSAVPLRIRQAAHMHPLRIVIVAAVLFTILLWMTWCKAWGSIKNTWCSGIRGIRESGKASILYVVAFPVIIGLTVLVFWFICNKIHGNPMTAPRFVFAGIIGLFAACLLVFRKTLKTQPEYLFLILVLCVGFLFSYYVPHTGLNSWDEDYHFKQALRTSYVDSVVLTPQDEVTIARNVEASYDLNGGIQELHDRQDRLYQSGATEKTDTVSIKGIPESFNGIGLFIGRALGLRYYMIHFMGRFIGLAAYAFIGFLAIRKLKSGKMIAAVSLLIPTEVFIASSYNYDAYLTCFTALGLCYYIAQWQDRKAPLSLKDAIIMIGSITFGCLTKQVYIPLLWILAILPRDKFADRRHHTYFILSMVIATGLIIYTYVAPDLAKGMTPMTEADNRGGAGISIGGQLNYIIRHPLAYFGVVWRYITTEYFNLNRLGEMFTNLAYHGIMPNQYIYLILLFVVTFTDKNKYDLEMAHHPAVHIWPIVISLFTLVLAITSMYLMFTPVGAERINGAQFRYVIPMFLPVLMHIGSGLIKNETNRGWYNGLVFAAAAYVEFACVYNGIIVKYI